MYDVNYFIKKFEAIPENKWAIATRCENGKRCAYGWCYKSDEDAVASMFTYGVTEASEEAESLRKLVMILSRSFGVGGINNGIYNEYQQPTPKQRILAALYDIKAMQQPKWNDISKELAILPVGETSDLTLIKQS